MNVRLHRHWLWVFLLSVGLALFLSLPYLLGYLTTPDGRFYTHLIMNPEDSQTYWAKMQQGLDGAWAYTIPFTTEAHDPAYVGIFYVWLGQAARLTGMSLTAVWHASRFVADIILFLTVYWFIGLFLPSPQSPTPNPRKTAFLLALFGSGLGWLLFMVQQPFWLNAFPIDFKQPGAHLFFTAMTFPHITLGTAFILLSIGVMRKLGNGQVASGKWQVAIILGVSNLLLGIAYPFLLYLVMTTAVFYHLGLWWQRRRLPWQSAIWTGIGFLIPAPLYLYYVNVLRVNAVFKAWDVQAVTPSAPWPHYVVAFGPYLLLAGLYVWKRPSGRPNTLILWGWLLSTALLLLAPLAAQRRFVQGVQVPLSILATLGLLEVLLPALIATPTWQRIVARPRYETAKLARLLIFLFLLLMSISTLYLWADVTRTAVLVQPDPFFRPQSELDAVAWLEQNKGGRTAVLGDMQTGNLLAARTGQPVFVGHWAETVAYEQRLAETARFFDIATDDAWRQALLEQHHIGYVWMGPRERELGSFDAAAADFLTAVYQNDEITIYKVEEK